VVVFSFKTVFEFYYRGSGKSRSVPFITASRPALEHNQPPIPWLSGALSLGI